MGPLVDLLEVETDYEIDVLREPADGENGYNHDHHFDHL